MRVNVEITFECEMPDEQAFIDETNKALKPLLDIYHASARITVAPKQLSFVVQGLWNG